MRTIGTVAESKHLQKNIQGPESLAMVEEEEFLTLLDICCRPGGASANGSSERRSQLAQISWLWVMNLSRRITTPYLRTLPSSRRLLSAFRLSKLSQLCRFLSGSQNGGRSDFHGHRGSTIQYTPSEKASSNTTF
jgi:hypothetical protein